MTYDNAGDSCSRCAIPTTNWLFVEQMTVGRRAIGLTLALRVG